MRDVIAHLDRWAAAGVASATATVVDVRFSAPRPVGAKMAVAADGSVEGMVSGGCVEGEVVLAAEAVLAGGAPRLLHFDVADEEAWEVGLPCGGEIAVWVQRADGPEAEGFAALARAGRRGALVTRLDTGARLLVPGSGPGAAGLHHGSTPGMARRGSGRGPAGPGDDPTPGSGTLGSPALDADAVRAARELMGGEHSARCDVGGVPLFIDVTAPPPRLLVVGAVDLAAALCRIARATGWEPSVCDPRSRFARPERFPDAEHVLASWPQAAFARLGPLDAATAVAVLTHDPKVDDAALLLALRSEAGYVGVMGSRRTHAARRARLLDQGLSEAELGRLAAPIGLDLGALTVEETALSIMAEVVAARRGRAGGRLSDVAGRIH